MTDTNGHAATPAAPQPALSPENAAIIQLTRKDFVSDQEVRWCPGCGDYSAGPRRLRPGSRRRART